MRRRVVRALRAAADDVPAKQPHEQTALELARAAIARDRALGWGLLALPQRLRIDTLDAFNAWLARQLPVLADGVAAADVVDKPEDLHREAARRCVAALADDDATLAESLRTLLRDVGNDCERLESLLAALLPRRDQWLRLLAGEPSRSAPRARRRAAAARRRRGRGRSRVVRRAAARGARAVAASRCRRRQRRVCARRWRRGSRSSGRRRPAPWRSRRGEASQRCC